MAPSISGEAQREGMGGTEGGMGMCSTVLTVPEALNVRWPPCQVFSGPPAMGSGLQGHGPLWVTQVQ